jgi:uncharacterized phage protein (TIGR02218 family)
MNYTEQELSLHDGQPVRLYLFERAAAARWAYTNADRAITQSGIEYRALPIGDDGIRLSGEASADQLIVTLPDDLDLVRLYRGIAPSDDIWLTIRDTHAGLPDAIDSTAVVWVGNVRACRRPEPGKAELVCNALSASMGKEGLRLSYERACPLSLYDLNCRAPLSAYRTEAVIAAMDGASVEIGLLAPIYAGGIIEWTEGLAVERRGIEAQAGDVLTLLGGTAGISTGQRVALYPGCDQTAATCKARFDNLANFGGFRHMPGKSPFDGDPIY